MCKQGSTILLVGVGAGHLVDNANGAKERVEFLIFTAPIGLNSKNFVI
jgi:hypothetical protein